MKIAIGFGIKESAWGGGNQFAISLVKASREKGFDITFDLVGSYDMGVLPTGHRMFVETGDGVFSGPGLNGTVRPKMGGEWATITDTGHIILDV